MQIFLIIVYQTTAKKSLHVAIVVFMSVVGITTITLAKPINNALVVPNDFALPSQAMKVNVVTTISKLT